MVLRGKVSSTRLEKAHRDKGDNLRLHIPRLSDHQKGIDKSDFDLYFNHRQPPRLILIRLSV